MDRPAPELVDKITNTQNITEVFHIQTSILELIAQRKSVSESLNELCLMSEKLVGDCLAAVMVFDESKTSLTVIASPSYSDEVRKDFSKISPTFGYGSCASAVATGKSMFVEDVSIADSWENVRDIAKKYDIGSCWSYPIYINGEIVGSFSLTSGLKRKPNPLHQYILQTASHLASFAIERAKADDLLLHSQIAFDNSTESILVANNEGVIFKSNPAFKKLTGFNSKSIKNLNFYNSFITDKDLIERLKNILTNKNHWRGNIDLKNQAGEILHLLMNIRKVNADNNLSAQFVIVLSDISKIKESENKLSHLAHHDILTNLPNRLSFEKAASVRLDNINEENSFVLMFIDLDEFKNINDNEGHIVGDELLKAVSKRLSSCVRDEDLIARYGGDEFTLIFSYRNMDDIENFAMRIINILAQPYRIQNKHHFTSASIGIALAPKDGEDIKQLISCADAAMYKAKAMGRNRHQFYSSDINNKIYGNIKIENDLLTAIENNELEILYQPIFSKEKLVLGYESLIRWNSRDVGVVEPIELLPLAEKAGLLDEIEEWVLLTAMQTAQSWEEENSKGEKIFINVSPLQIKSKLLEIVQNALSISQFKPENLVIELSENILDANLHENRKVIESLCELGVQLAIDDFGTGHLSLEPIKLFPIKYIKLDKCLIKNFPLNAQDEKILDMIFSLSQAMSITIIGEGVESEEQFKWLVDRRCDYFQGFMLSSPLSVKGVLNIR